MSSRRGVAAQMKHACPVRKSRPQIDSGPGRGGLMMSWCAAGSWVVGSCCHERDGRSPRPSRLGRGHEPASGQRHSPAVALRLASRASVLTGSLWCDGLRVESRDGRPSGLPIGENPRGERLDAVHHRLEARGVEDVERVLPARELGVDHGVARGAAQAGDEVPSALDGAPGVPGAVGDEEWRRLTVDVPLRLERRRRAVRLRTEVVPVIAVEADGAGYRRVDRLDAGLKQRWRRGDRICAR